MVSKFHDDSTIEKSGILVLLGQVLGLCGNRESYDVKDICLTSDIVSQISMSRMFEIEF